MQRGRPVIDLSYKSSTHWKASSATNEGLHESRIYSLTCIYQQSFADFNSTDKEEMQSCGLTDANLV